MSLNVGSLYPACHSLLQEGTSPLPDKTVGLSLSLRNHLCLLPVGLQYFCIAFLLILTGTNHIWGPRINQRKDGAPGLEWFPVVCQVCSARGRAVGDKATKFISTLCCSPRDWTVGLLLNGLLLQRTN